MPMLGGRFGRREQICHAAVLLSLAVLLKPQRAHTRSSGAVAISGVVPPLNADLRSRGVFLGSPLQKEGEGGDVWVPSVDKTQMQGRA